MDSKSYLSLLGILTLAGCGAFLTHSWMTGLVVFLVLATAAYTAGDLKLPGIKRRP